MINRIKRKSLKYETEIDILENSIESDSSSDLDPVD